jgi:hypoxanthine phosphoribosyltransferase
MPAPEHTLRELYSAEAVSERIREIGERLYRDYADTPALFLVIAQGARRFADTLVKGLIERNVHPEVIFLRARRTAGSALGEVQVQGIDPAIFEDRDILILDDIADEGRTLEAVSTLVQDGEPRSQRVAVLVSKLSRRKVDIALDYVGFEVDEGWVVGFGMDLDERYRDLDYLAVADGAE